MLKTISTRQLRIGMHIHKVCGSWLDHSFWRGSFPLKDDAQVRRLQAVAEVVIDTDKGLDVAGADPVLMDDVELDAAQAQTGAGDGVSADDAMADASRAQAAPQGCGLPEELQRAQAIVGAARAVVQNLYQDARLGKAVDAQHCLPMVEDITRSVSRNPNALVSLSRLKTSDDYTYMHSVAVCALMVALARQLGLDEEATRQAGLGGLVHDLGKAQVPLAVLNKPGALTQEEFAIMKGHPEAGHRMLREGLGAGEVALDVCLHHHEKINGKGYPHGLQGEQISLFARMGAVCDVYDAITSNRPYKAGWDPAQSIQKMAQWAKEGHFDQQVFQAFVKSIGIYPTGSLVRLQSGLLGVVVEQGGVSLLRPRVRVFHNAVANEPVPPRLIDLGDPACGEQIVSRESADAWGLGDTDPFWMNAGG